MCTSVHMCGHSDGRQVRKIQSRVMCNGQRFTQMHIQSMWPKAIQQFKNVSTSINSSGILRVHIWITVVEGHDAIPFRSISYLKLFSWITKLLEDANVQRIISMAWQQFQRDDYNCQKTISSF